MVKGVQVHVRDAKLKSRVCLPIKKIKKKAFNLTLELAYGKLGRLVE